MDVPVPMGRGDLADLTELLINLLYSSISFYKVLWEIEKRKIPLKNGHILQYGAIRAPINSIEDIRLQREKLNYYFFFIY